MKSRFKQILKITPFLLLLLSSFVLAQSHHPALQDMYSFAAEELPRILAYIPVNNEVNYGFKSRDEFKRAGLGIPYQEYQLDTELPTGYWRIPVTVNGENRALLRLIKNEAGWEFAGFGGAKLAAELQEFEKVVGKSKAASGRIIRDFRMHCDYIQFNREPGTKINGLLYPLESAARVLLRSGVATTVGFEGYPLEQIRAIRSGIKKAAGEHNPEKE